LQSSGVKNAYRLKKKDPCATKHAFDPNTCNLG